MWKHWWHILGRKEQFNVKKIRIWTVLNFKKFWSSKLFKVRHVKHFERQNLTKITRSKLASFNSVVNLIVLSIQPVSSDLFSNFKPHRKSSWVHRSSSTLSNTISLMLLVTTIKCGRFSLQSPFSESTRRVSSQLVSCLASSLRHLQPFKEAQTNKARVWRTPRRVQL